MKVTGSKLNPEYSFTAEELRSNVVKLSKDEVEHLLGLIDEKTINVIDKIIPGLPFIKYLKYQINMGTFTKPTYLNYVHFSDALSSGKIQFPLN